MHFFDKEINTCGRKKRKKLVRRWIRERKGIECMCSKGKGRFQKRRNRGQGTVLPGAAEEQIVLRINSSRREGIPVSTGMLTLKTLEVAAEIGIDPDSFRASSSWARCFFRRHKLSIRARPRQGQTTPDDAIRYLPRRTIDKRNSRTVWMECVGKEKERPTAMLVADSDGNKRPPFLVFKTRPSSSADGRAANTNPRNGFGRTLRKKIAPLQFSSGCRIYGNAKGWWNEVLSVEFLKFHFAERENCGEPIFFYFGTIFQVTGPSASSTTQRRLEWCC
eukprot:jgi/Phyca11/104392/e_gw1.9.806.1